LPGAPKSPPHGPCGGSTKGKCEIDPEVDCGWQLILDRLRDLDQMDRYEQILEIADWRTSRDASQKMIRRTSKDERRMQDRSKLEKILRSGKVRRYR